MKSFKVLSVADIHLRGGHETDEARALMQTAEYAAQKEIDLVCVNGDVFHAKSTPEQRLVFKDFLNVVRKSEVVILRGNHDELDDLMVFHDPVSGVHVSQQPQAWAINGRSGSGRDYDLEVFTIPHFNAGRIAASAESLSSVGDTGAHLFTQLIEGIRQKIAARAVDGLPSMVIFHGTVSDAVLDNGKILKHDGIELNGELLSSLGVPVRGGHYHERQEVKPLVWYSGSLTLQNFGETGSKGFIVDEFDGKEWLPPQNVDVLCTPRITVDAQWIDGEFILHNSEQGVSLSLEDPTRFAGARVRFRYKVNQSDIPKVNIEPVVAFFKDALELKIEKDVVMESRVRSEEIQTANTVPDMLDAWLEVKGIPEAKPVIRGLYEQVCLGVERVEEPAMLKEAASV